MPKLSFDDEYCNPEKRGNSGSIEIPDFIHSFSYSKEYTALPRRDEKYNLPINFGESNIYQSAYTNISLPLFCFIAN
jgi:hypothetical protein